MPPVRATTLGAVAGEGVDDDGGRALAKVVNPCWTPKDLLDTLFELGGGQALSLRDVEQILHLLIGGRLVVGRGFVARRLSVGSTSRLWVAFTVGGWWRRLCVPARKGIVALVSLDLLVEGLFAR
ncbi:MAG: hypothetical protein K2Y37_25670 [Pirellulales bacterium]|nr:hypothetical protein [Pirellulales bacterium]